MGDTASFMSRMTRLVGRSRSWIPRRPVRLDPERSALARRNLRTIQTGTLGYHYNNVPCLKNPFDLALYTMLLGQLRPTTIVEIGSAAGGSALWFAAQARALHLECAVLSVDINKVTTVSDPDVTFLGGDIHHLDTSALPAMLGSRTGPLLVIEDGPHTFGGSLAALRFFDDYLQPGDYIVIEDGIAKDLGYRHLRNGPNRAVRQFLSDHGDRYTVDRSYCDFFGRNITWNPNGYLRRITPDVTAPGRTIADGAP